MIIHATIGEKRKGRRSRMLVAIRLALEEANKKLLEDTKGSKEERKLEREYANLFKKHTTHKLNEAILDIDDKLHDQVDIKNKRALLFFRNILKQALRLRREHAKQAPRLPMEKNYAASPLFSASNQQMKTVIKMKNDNGELIQNRNGFRTMTYSNGQGNHLKTTDLRIFLGLQRLWELKGGKSTFSFTYGELCEVVEYEKTSGIYEMIEASLNSLFNTSVKIEDYKDVDLKKKIETSMHNLFPNMHFDHEVNTVTIEFNEFLNKGLSEGNKIWINITLFCDLSTKASKILYPLLSSVFAEEDQELDIDKILESLDLINAPRKRAIKQLREAFDDLKKSDVILDYEFEKIGRSYKKVKIIAAEELLTSIGEGLLLPEQS